VYEPGLSVNGSMDLSFLPAVVDLIGRRRFGTAMGRWITGLEAFRTAPAEARETQRLDSDGSEYAAVTTPTLLLGGGRSPGYLLHALRELDRILPNATLMMSPQLDHNAPDLNAPETVAGLMRAFLTPADATF
jgi:hypothetical protein